MDKFKDALLPLAMDTVNLAQNSQTEWSWDEELVIGMVVEGNITLHVEDGSLQLRPGDGFFLNWQCRHSFENTKNGYALIYLLHFSPRLVGGSRDSVYWQGYLNPILQNRAFSCEIFWRNNPADSENLQHTMYAFRILQYRAPGYEFLIRNELSFLILDIYGRQTVLQTDVSEKEIRNEERIRRMLDFIEQHYMDEFSLEDVAESASLSVSECIRCFKTTLNTTPIQYVLQYRLMKAADLITHTNKSMNDIGEACGFHEMSYFTRVFKRQYKMTPLAYRKSNKKS